MGQKLAHYEIKAQIAIVTMDHPPMNALDAATKEAIAEVFRELDDRRQEIRVVILHGAGEKAFAAGADIKTFLELTPDTARRRLSRSHQIYSIVENFQWPVVGAIHGFCLGGGLELALCCDIRYAEETAKFGFPEVNLSVFPGNGGIARSLYHLPLGKLKVTDGLFLEVSRDVAARYPDIAFEDRIVDNMCMQLVQKPELYDVLVLPNLCGGIVSDLAAGLIGGLGLAPGANIGDEIAVFEPTHGSAPKYRSLNKMNPFAMILSGVMMLRHLGEIERADRIERAVAHLVREGRYVTYDMKPTPDDPTAATTSQVADALIDLLKR